MKRLFIVSAALFLPFASLRGQSLEEEFRNPPREVRPLMIWQWMDGVVTAEGITADLEAYREAGIGGVQQFLVGGPLQTRISDTTQAIGTESWRQLMRHAIAECARLGLTFGTHNCPGWSSSAFPAVRPEDSMQKLVWSETVAEGEPDEREQRLTLPRPEVDSQWNYYCDIAVVAVPDAEKVNPQRALVLAGMAADGTLGWRVPAGRWRVYRFGHTTNGKTNWATAPTGGVGLECDKMSRRAVERYWDGYPSELLRLAGAEAGRTFQRLEIDSYEAGGQDWTPLMREEFEKRHGYDLLPWLPLLAGAQAADSVAGNRFEADFRETVTDLFAENYYGHMSRLAHRYPGLRMLIQPYGTGAARPFNPIHTDKIVAQLAEDDAVCAEFWTHPDWGWNDLPRVTSAAYGQGRSVVYAEGFTCWPLHAWKDDPASLKVVADRAFCLGINALMLHAGAQNPWTDKLPGMTFGQWGTQWTPGQTWWRSGGARELFTYLSRCQSLLQRGRYVDDSARGGGSLVSDSASLQWIHRSEADGTDIYFIANPLDSAFTTTVSLVSQGRLPEIWHPDTGETAPAPAWSAGEGRTRVTLELARNESLFVLLRRATDDPGPGLALRSAAAVAEIAVEGPWTLAFPEGWDAPAQVELKSLVPWNEHAEPGIRYFSGTARYSVTVPMKRLDSSLRYVLNLGEVKNLAKVYVNGELCAHLWKEPFVCDITGFLRRGDNRLEIEVTNLWPNRMIGDEQYPDDIEWSEPLSFEGAKAGSFMQRIPQWLREGEPRPSVHRKTVVSFKFFEKDSPLLESGLLGPVRVEVSDPRQGRSRKGD